MANSSAKKLIRANAARLRRLLLTILASHAAYLLVRVVLRRATLDALHLVAWLVLAGASAAPFFLLWTAARPRYFDDGTLVHGGEDIAAPGVLEYAHDLIYVAVAAQLGLLVSPWALLLLAVVPAYAVYASCCAAKGEAAHDVAEDLPAAAGFAGLSRKERRKAERDARKQR